MENNLGANNVSQRVLSAEGYEPSFQNLNSRKRVKNAFIVGSSSIEKYQGIKECKIFATKIFKTF